MKYIIWCVLVGIYVFMSVWYAADVELETAVSWMYENWLTKYDNIKSFRPEDYITREEAAKFAVQYGSNIIWSWFMESYVEDLSCEFNDKNLFDVSLVKSIFDACKHRIFKWSKGSFMPKQQLTQAQWVTVVRRLISWWRTETIPIRYEIYFMEAQSKWMLVNTSIVNIAEADNRAISRWDFARLMFAAYGLRREHTSRANVVGSNYDNLTVNYVGRLDDGSIFDTNMLSIAQRYGIYSEDRIYEPLNVNMQDSRIIDWFKQGLMGMEIWKERTIKVSPENGYWLRKEELVYTTGVAIFTSVGLYPVLGKQYSFGEWEDWAVATVTNISNNTVTLDFNHILAWKVLFFTLEVLTID